MITASVCKHIAMESGSQGPNSLYLNQHNWLLVLRPLSPWRKLLLARRKESWTVLTQETLRFSVWQREPSPLSVAGCVNSLHSFGISGNEEKCQTAVLWDVAPCCLVDTDRRSRGACCLQQYLPDDTTQHPTRQQSSHSSP